LQARVRVVLVGVEGEVNLGFIVRLCANFRADELVLVSPQVDPYSETVKRYAANGVWFLERVRVVGTLEEALRGVDVAACTSAKIGGSSDVLRHAYTVREFAENIAPRYESIGLVFGRESVGLTRDEIAKCDLLIHIPANPEYPVLNLSHAVAITLYELYTALTSPSRGKLFEAPRRETLERLLDHAHALIEAVVDRERREAVLSALKHVLWGCGLTSGEASSLYHFFKKLRKTMENCIRLRAEGAGGVEDDVYDKPGG
jgi:TrmH family RNA methyltransferase